MKTVQIAASLAIAVLLLAGCGPAAPTPRPVPPTATSAPAPTVVPTVPPPTSTAAISAGTIVLIFGQRFITELYTTVRSTLEQANYRVVVASRSLTPLQIGRAHV